jgi:carbon-monoxide dehydrogenase medium subunit
MKPAPFAYIRPDSLDAALVALAERPDEARIIAGGQSLMPMLNLRLAQAGLLVDINRIPGLDVLSEEPAGLRVGATVRHADLLAHVARSDAFPLLAVALPLIAHQAVRNRGTVCGSLALADPASELPACALCLDAEITVASTRGRRVIPASDFFLGLYETALAPDEMIVDVLFPRAQADWRFGFEEVSRRRGDFAMAGLANGMNVVNGVIEQAHIVLFGVADRPVRATAAEDALTGERLAAPATQERALEALAAIEVAPSGEYSSAYKRHLLSALLRRALADHAKGAS